MSANKTRIPERSQRINETGNVGIQTMGTVPVTKSPENSTNNTQDILVSESTGGEEVDLESKNGQNINDKTYQYQFWLVGSSVIKDLKPKLIYKYKRMRITTLRDKTVQGTQEFLKL